MITEWDPDKAPSLMDHLDNIWGKLDYLDVLETFVRTAIAPVSKNATHGRFDMALIPFPRGDKFDVQATGGETVRLFRRAGIVCGCIGFDSHYTYWLVRRSQLKLAQYIMQGEPGGPLKQPKSLWGEKPGKGFLSSLLDEFLR